MVNWKVKDRQVIILNSEVNCIKTNASGINTSFTWNNLNIKIDDPAHIFISNFQKEGTGDGSKIITFRISGVDYTNYKSTGGNGNPVIFFGSFSTNSYWNGEDTAITLRDNQYINSITLLASDTLSNPNAGIADTLKFMMCLIVEEFDPEYTQFGNAYGEARINNLNNKRY